MKSEATTKKLNIATNVIVYVLKSAASVAAVVCGHAVWPLSMPGSVVLSVVEDRGRAEGIWQTESEERRVVGQKPPKEINTPVPKQQTKQERACAQFRFRFYFECTRDAIAAHECTLSLKTRSQRSVRSMHRLYGLASDIIDGVNVSLTIYLY